MDIGASRLETPRMGRGSSPEGRVTQLF